MSMQKSSAVGAGTKSKEVRLSSTHPPPLHFLLLLCLLQLEPTFASKKLFIAYLGSHDDSLTQLSEPSALDLDTQRTAAHKELLGSFLKSDEKVEDAIIYSHTRHINAFSASIDEDVADKLGGHPNVIAVLPNERYELHTTRSWQFLGLLRDRDGVPIYSDFWKQANFGEGVIIGNIDTGVDPTSKSFRDQAGEVPSKWRGKCQASTLANLSVTCNSKLIGAKFFVKGAKALGLLTENDPTPYDLDGHGSHTLSTAVGDFVEGVNVLGQGKGTATGGSPRALAAAYKACSYRDCFSVDILAAFDAAISDGVDVLSVSLGLIPTANYLRDVIAIGSLEAVKRGIMVVVSAGNGGPMASSVENLAPWLFTVAASTIDRDFANFLEIGDGKKTQFKGASIVRSNMTANKMYPLILARDAKAENATAEEAELCEDGSLRKEKVQGKIVVCMRGVTARVSKGEQVLLAGGIGMVLINGKADGRTIIADPHLLAATHLGYRQGLDLLKYMNSTESPMGYISSAKTMYGVKPAPLIASFSSRGPNSVSPQILKPDIAAPGVNIIAAYSKAVPPTGFDYDKRRFHYNLMSGTSMSCPHVAGLAGALKSLHPDWSPAAIKSALMTTATSRDNTMQGIRDESNELKASPFAYGAGNVHPMAALNPGLVYDLNYTDYLNFLCANEEIESTVVGRKSSITSSIKRSTYQCPTSYSLNDFNYPTISIVNLTAPTTLTRTLKNVGVPNTYFVAVRSPPRTAITVKPKKLKFERVGQQHTFKLTAKPINGSITRGYVFGSLVWYDSNKHRVRSQIVVSKI